MAMELFEYLKRKEAERNAKATQQEYEYLMALMHKHSSATKKPNFSNNSFGGSFYYDFSKPKHR